MIKKRAKTIVLQGSLNDLTVDKVCAAVYKNVQLEDTAAVRSVVEEAAVVPYLIPRTPACSVPWRHLCPSRTPRCSPRKSSTALCMTGSKSFALKPPRAAIQLAIC